MKPASSMLSVCRASHENRTTCSYRSRSSDIAFARSGGLKGYGPNIHNGFHQTARMVAKVLQGAKPADLPVELPTKFELVINLKTAKAIGIELPTSILLRADEVIE
jgi:putative ABC transport system substrate-binding protein